MLAKLSRVLGSASNWCGLALATGVLLLKGLGLLGAAALPLALAGYVAGFIGGGLWLGFPRLNAPEWEPLAFTDEGDARQAMERALYGVRHLTQANPGNRLPAPLQSRVLALCKGLDELLAQWERSRGHLSLEDSFDARRIAITYLPDALNTYLSIPPAYATTRLLENGKTASDTFQATLQELEGKVQQLADDLAAQDARAFLLHSQFVRQKFGDGSVLPELPRDPH